MKSGLSLAQLAAEIERRAANKADFIAPIGKMSRLKHQYRSRPPS